MTFPAFPDKSVICWRNVNHDINQSELEVKKKPCSLHQERENGRKPSHVWFWTCAWLAQTRQVCPDWSEGNLQSFFYRRKSSTSEKKNITINVQEVLRTSYLWYKNTKTTFFAAGNCKTERHISGRTILEKWKIHELRLLHFFLSSWSKLTNQITIVTRRDLALAAHAMFRSPSWPLMFCWKGKK